MPKVDVFTAQTANATVQLADANGNPIAIDGVLAVDIAGTLGAAKVTTYIKHANAEINQWIAVADGTWPFDDTETYSGSDGAIIPMNSHFVKFVLASAGGGTSISLTAGW